MLALMLCILSPRSPHDRSTLLAVSAQQHAPFAVEARMNRLALIQEQSEEHDDDEWTTRPMTLVADYTWQLNVTLQANSAFYLVNLNQDGTPDWTTKLGRGSDSNRLEIGGSGMPVQSRGRYLLTYFTPSFAQSRLPLLLDGAPSVFWMQSTQLWPSLIINSTSFVAVRSPILVHLYFSVAVNSSMLAANFSRISVTGNVKWANEATLVAHTASHYSFAITPFEAHEPRPAESEGDVISIAVPAGITFAVESTGDGVTSLASVRRSLKNASTGATDEDEHEHDSEDDGDDEDEGGQHLPNTAAQFSLIYSPLARRRGTPYWHPLMFPRDVSTNRVVTALHANLVGSMGAVLMTGWEREQELTCDADSSDASRKVGVTFLLDPAELDAREAQAVSLSMPLHNLRLPIVALDESAVNATDALYCSGHAPLRDGRKLFAGGSSFANSSSDASTGLFESGLDYARIWDPLSSNFSVLSNDPLLPFGPAWHPSLARLADGRVLMAGGVRDSACVTQSSPGAACFNPALALFNVSALDAGGSGWQWLLPASASDAAAINPGAEDYARLWVLGSPVLAGGWWRSVAMMGSAGTVVLVDVEASTPDAERFFHPPNGARPLHTGSSPCNTGSASVVVSTGELLLAGGCGGSWIDLYNPLRDSWRSVDTGIARNFASAVLLPDGTVLLLNGENPVLDQTTARSGQTQQSDPRYFQILDPITLRIDTYPELEEADPEESSSIASFRGLHNMAALLLDGRVLISGGVQHRQRGDVGCEQPNLRLLSPPYFRPFNLSAANDTDSDLVAAASTFAAPLAPRPEFDVAAMLNSSWGSPFNASEFAAQFLNRSCAPIFLRVNTTAQLAVRFDASRASAASAADLSLRNEPPLDPLLQAGGGLLWDSALRFGGGGLVLLALQSSTHAFDANQRYVSLQYADTESNDTASWSAGGADDDARENNATTPLPAERSIVVRVLLPAAPVLNPGEYLLFALSASGVPSVGLHTRVLSATEDAVTAYSYSSPSGSRVSGGGLPYYPITPGDGRGSDASPWDRQNILLMAFLGGAGVLFFLGLALWFWRKQSSDARRADMNHAMRTPAALRMHTMGRAAHQQGFDPLA